ncbi:hypothetical protein D9615_010259 [Tricholomella constricta]|uniref:HAT C-terminal dimerisation domain-containing protein n=1 Tax=Tricholomella constricta TaxID=117010 RepID=A0A8H5GRH6_9AGAR|nr:hypothetical protein D9615_010259 [Tricholomella constricta]
MKAWKVIVEDMKTAKVKDKATPESQSDEIRKPKTLGQFTLDNAGNNNTTLRRLVELLKRDGIEYSEDGNRVRCFPHVINIATQTIIKELKENPTQPIQTDLVSLSDSVPNTELLGHDSPQQYVAALVADPVGKTRSLVAACRKSGQRRSDLSTVIKNGNNDGSWTLRILQLLRDCETRWSSTHLMTGRALDLYPAIERFLQLPKQIDLVHLLFTETEFQVLHDIQTILSIPHAAQELLSAEKTPTLSMALPAYEMIITAWLNLQKKIPILAHYIGVGIHKLQDSIYLALPVINPEVKLDWITTHWSSADAANAKEWIIETCFQSSAPRQPPQVFSSRGPMLLRDRSMAWRSSTALAQHIVEWLLFRAWPPVLTVPSPTPLTPAQQAEQERQGLQHDRVVAEKEFLTYISRGLETGQTLLRYWDVNEMDLPLMFSVAMDVLPVQASAVPCERVFSLSKETTTLRRSCLSPGLMEMLQVLKYAYKQDRLDFTEDWVAKEEDYTIGGEVTESAVRELMLSGKVDELYELLTAGALPVNFSSFTSWDDDWSPELP